MPIDIARDLLLSKPHKINRLVLMRVGETMISINSKIVLPSSNCSSYQGLVSHFPMAINTSNLGNLAIKMPSKILSFLALSIARILHFQGRQIRIFKAITIKVFKVFLGKILTQTHSKTLHKTFNNLASLCNSEPQASQTLARIDLSLALNLGANNYNIHREIRVFRPKDPMLTSHNNDPELQHIKF